MRAVYIPPRYLYIFLAITLNYACSQAPTKAIDSFTSEHGLQKVILTTEKHSLITLNSPSLNLGQPTIHIYLEGDGRAWQSEYHPSPNPTSRSFLALQLLSEDPFPAIYLNRPCYGWATPPLTCHSKLWTDARYGEEVVVALNEALDIIKNKYENSQYLLFGHSGGGTLAMLLAQRRRDIAAVITIGGNLDPKAWTQHFSYSPLRGSLNPIEIKQLNPNTIRWHLVGLKDKVVPYSLTQKAANTDPLAKVIQYPYYGHHCCWKDMWKIFVLDLNNTLSKQGEPQ